MSGGGGQFERLAQDRDSLGGLLLVAYAQGGVEGVSCSSKLVHQFGKGFCSRSVEYFEDSQIMVAKTLALKINKIKR